MCSSARARGVTGLLDTYCNKDLFLSPRDHSPFGKAGACDSREVLVNAGVDSPGSAFVI
ncbi:hypothetical protein BS47DRAFT_1343534, partial [Hydnum rufescens UP504]